MIAVFGIIFKEILRDCIGLVGSLRLIVEEVVFLIASIGWLILTIGIVERAHLALNLQWLIIIVPCWFFESWILKHKSLVPILELVNFLCMSCLIVFLKHEWVNEILSFSVVWMGYILEYLYSLVSQFVILALENP